MQNLFGSNNGKVIWKLKNGQEGAVNFTYPTIQNLPMAVSVFAGVSVLVLPLDIFVIAVDDYEIK